MKDYQELTLLLSESVDHIVEKMESVQLSSGWERNRDAENSFRRNSANQFRFVVFECCTFESRFASRLSLLVKGETVLELSGIYPLKGSPNPLEFDNYNAVLVDFYSRIVLPLENQGLLTATLFQGEFDMKVELGEQIYQKLKLFSDAANKSTGSGHWCDRNRWCDFLCSLHNSDVKLSASVLKRWLSESEGWSSEQALKLALEFEFAMDILDFQNSRNTSN